MGVIDQTEMWKIGEGVRANRTDTSAPFKTFTAGVFCATMMAQIDTLMDIILFPLLVLLSDTSVRSVQGTYLLTRGRCNAVLGVQRVSYRGC